MRLGCVMSILQSPRIKAWYTGGNIERCCGPFTVTVMEGVRDMRQSSRQTDPPRRL